MFARTLRRSAPGRSQSTRAFSSAVRVTTQLKEMFQSKELGYLMEAHNGLSAKICAEVGFKGIWASGLSMSASLGVRDSNEASWTQVLDCVEYMVDANNGEVPILLDGDTGYGKQRVLHFSRTAACPGVCS